MNLKTARVFVRDLTAADRFYSKQLGFPWRGGGASFQAWGGVLATFEDPEGNELQIVQA